MLSIPWWGWALHGGRVILEIVSAGVVSMVVGIFLIGCRGIVAPLIGGILMLGGAAWSLYGPALLELLGWIK